jgi:hypothetical protein
LFNLDGGHQAAVVELGTNHPGELAPLVRIAQPSFGVLTNIGREHLEFSAVSKAWPKKKVGSQNCCRRAYFSWTAIARGVMALSGGLGPKWFVLVLGIEMTGEFVACGSTLAG